MSIISRRCENLSPICDIRLLTAELLNPTSVKWLCTSQEIQLRLHFFTEVPVVLERGIERCSGACSRGTHNWFLTKTNFCSWGLVSGKTPTLSRSAEFSLVSKPRRTSSNCKKAMPGGGPVAASVLKGPVPWLCYVPAMEVFPKQVNFCLSSGHGQCCVLYFSTP